MCFVGFPELVVAHDLGSRFRQCVSSPSAITDNNAEQIDDSD
jgi:hypothetical protein